jgi:hypothetical protein
MIDLTQSSFPNAYEHLGSEDFKALKKIVRQRLSEPAEERPAVIHFTPSKRQEETIILVSLEKLKQWFNIEG